MASKRSQVQEIVGRRQYVGGVCVAGYGVEAACVSMKFTDGTPKWLDEDFPSVQVAQH